MAAADVELRSMDVSVLDAGKANNKNNFMARATRRVYIALCCSDKIIDIPRTPQSSVAQGRTQRGGLGGLSPPKKF